MHDLILKRKRKAKETAGDPSRWIFGAEQLCTPEDRHWPHHACANSRIPTLTLPLHTCTSSTTSAHLTRLNALAALSPVAWITWSDSYSTRMRFLTLACKSSSHYRRGPPILAPPPPGGLGVATPVYPRPADCRIRISPNVTPVELAVALDCFPASCSLYPAKAEDPAPATIWRISDTP